jgi:hypothetical protein
MKSHLFLLAITGLNLTCLVSASAFAWGDDGHEIVGLIADHYLEPAVRAKVQTMLASDATGLTPDTGIAFEATWADKYRDSDRNTTKVVLSSPPYRQVLWRPRGPRATAL